MGKQISVYLMETNQQGKIIEIENSLKSFQSLVDGYIESIKITNDLCVICNEDGKRLHLPDNRMIYHNNAIVEVLKGTIFIVRDNSGDEYDSINESDIAIIEGILKPYPAKLSVMRQPSMQPKINLLEGLPREETLIEKMFNNDLQTEPTKKVKNVIKGYASKEDISRITIIDPLTDEIALYAGTFENFMNPTDMMKEFHDQICEMPVVKSAINCGTQLFLVVRSQQNDEQLEKLVKLCINNKAIDISDISKRFEDSFFSEKSLSQRLDWLYKEKAKNDIEKARKERFEQNKKLMADMVLNSSDEIYIIDPNKEQ